MQNKREKNTSQAFAEFEHTKNSAKISQAIKKGVFNNFQSFCECAHLLRGCTRGTGTGVFGTAAITENNI